MPTRFPVALLPVLVLFLFAGSAVAADTFEPDDSVGQAVELLPETTQRHSLVNGSVADVDWMRVTVPYPAQVTVAVSAMTANADLVLYAADGTTSLGSSANAGTADESIMVSLSPGTYLACVRSPTGGEVSSYSISLTLASTVQADAFESLSDESTGTLNAIASGSTQAHTLHSASDEDWVSFTVPVTSNVVATLTGLTADADVVVYAADGSTRIAVSERGQTSDEQINLFGLSAGTYYFRVFGYGGAIVSSYSLSFTATPGDSGILADAYEANADGAAGTTTTTIASGESQHHTIHRSEDADWIRFTLASAADVQVTLANPTADGDLAVYAADGTTRLGKSSNSGQNPEEVLLYGLPAGTYLITIYGYGGAVLDYDLALTTTVPQASVAADPFEPNESAPVANEIRAGEPQVHTLHTSVDFDWCYFTLSRPSNVTITMRGMTADADVYLYENDGSTYVAASENYGVEDETISVMGLAAGTYRLHIFGWNGAVMGAFTLALTTEPVVSPDAYEDDGTMAQAVLLPGTQIDRTLHAGDTDWCKFVLGQQSDVVVQVASAEGDPELAVYDATGLLLATEVADVCTLWNLAPGTYYCRTIGTFGALVPSYRLTVTSTASSVVTAADAYEVDDSPAAAKAATAGVAQARSLHTPVDVDWISFSVPSSGSHRLRASVSGASQPVLLEVYSASPLVRVAGPATASAGQDANVSAVLWSGSFLLRASTASSSAVAAYSIRYDLAPVPLADSWEPDDTAATAHALGAGRTSGHTIHAAGNQDWSTFTIGSTARVVVDLDGLDEDAVLELYRVPGTAADLIVSSNQTGTQAERIDVSALAAGTYLVQVRTVAPDGLLAGYNLGLTVQASSQMVLPIVQSSAVQTSSSGGSKGCGLGGGLAVMVALGLALRSRRRR